MDYLVDGKHYALSYSELKEKYIQMCEMTDEEFMKNLVDAAHLACIICYLKEIPAYVCISDEGVIHQLIHLMDEEVLEVSPITIEEVRKTFETTLKLA